MKVFKFLAAVLVASAFSISVSAQETTAENMDENGKIVRGPYLSNGFGANWFVGAAGGVNIFMNGAIGYSGLVGGALDIYVGKWFIPDLGVRVAYQGLTGRMNGAEFAGVDDKLVEKFQFWYLHGDVMWNISNTIGGYKESRFWNFVPYAHFGTMRIFDHENPAYDEGQRVNAYDNELALGVGLYNTLRFSKRVYGTIDVRETMFSPRFHGNTGVSDLGGVCSNLSVTAGIGVYLGKVGWERGSRDNGSAAAAAAAVAAAEAALLAAKEANNALSDDVNRLKDQLDSLEKAAQNLDKVYINDTTYVSLKLGTAPCTLYFAMGSSTLNATELQHLDFYVKNIINQDPDHAFYLTGTADSSTGTNDLNEQLSKNRVENVRKLIMDKYGISSDRLIIKDAKVSNKFSDPRLDRSVIIEH